MFGKANVTPVGVSADGLVSEGLIIWFKFDSTQTPNYSNITQTQTPNYSNITQTQIPNWEDVA